MVRPDPGTLQDAVAHTEDVADFGIDTSNTKALVKMRNALISLEKAAEEARKQVIEPALDDEMDVGDCVAGVERVERERRTVTDNAAALKMLEEVGADPAGVLKIYPKQFADAVDGGSVDPSVVIEREKSTFYRRDG